MPTRFITYLIKPWEELNYLLSKQYAFQPDLSDIILMSSNIAVSIKHQAEHAGLSRSLVDTESFANRMMSDVADSWKHGGTQLHDPARMNSLSVSSCFEFNDDNQFRFIRNSVTVSHVTHGKHDLLELEAEAIVYWIKKLGLQLSWSPLLQAAKSGFESKVYLYYNPKYQVEMRSFNLSFFRRNLDGNLVLADPKVVNFEISWLPESELK